MARPTAPRGLARQRVLDAALALFAEHGVHGTSLQMIADRIGVSKAAVYYQFRSKEDIALEVLRPSIDDMARVIRIAEVLPDMQRRREVLVSGLIEMVVRHRELSVLFYGDPGIDQMVRDEPEFSVVTGRLQELLEDRSHAQPTVSPCGCSSPACAGSPQIPTCPTSTTANCSETSSSCRPAFSRRHPCPESGVTAA